MYLIIYIYIEDFIYQFVVIDWNYYFYISDFIYDEATQIAPMCFFFWFRKYLFIMNAPDKQKKNPPALNIAAATICITESGLKNIIDPAKYILPPNPANKSTRTPVKSQHITLAKSFFLMPSATTLKTFHICETKTKLEPAMNSYKPS